MFINSTNKIPNKKIDDFVDTESIVIFGKWLRRFKNVDKSTDYFFETLTELSDWKSDFNYNVDEFITELKSNILKRYTYQHFLAIQNVDNITIKDLHYSIINEVEKAKTDSSAIPIVFGDTMFIYKYNLIDTNNVRLTVKFRKENHVNGEKDITFIIQKSFENQNITDDKIMEFVLMVLITFEYQYIVNKKKSKQ